MMEIIKDGSPDKIKEWDRSHDPRRTYRCDRCGCVWKCEYNENHFGSAHEYNGDPDILCPYCHAPEGNEIVTLSSSEHIDFTDFLNGGSHD